ncbi:hypothetical protein RHMOL_Rhmol03G0118800 [Rhododendron molle]|uniref:Uncharacterized protein n=1 Tax=Rhododendron molle TaxID=49168 RepID=A0ACC0PFK6_RHOML|nr:hypothetical protein RHMOL_Rhmol03G0118800 [Rhododendron molle]
MGSNAFISAWISAVRIFVSKIVVFLNTSNWNLTTQTLKPLNPSTKIVPYSSDATYKPSWAAAAAAWDPPAWPPYPIGYRNPSFDSCHWWYSMNDHLSKPYLSLSDRPCGHIEPSGIETGWKALGLDRGGPSDTGVGRKALGLDMRGPSDGGFGGLGMTGNGGNTGVGGGVLLFARLVFGVHFRRPVPVAGFYIWEKPAWLNGEAGLWCFVRRWMLKVARV